MTVEYRIGAEGTVTPPADMMQAARLSLTPTGFDNLMARTGGRTPTPAELVEFADAERAAGIVHPHEQIALVTGELAAETSASADMQGTTVVLPGDFINGHDANQAEHGFGPLTSSD